jgi:hypothetical protein
MHRPMQTSREVTLTNDKEAPSDDVTRCAQDGVKGGNKHRKQRPLRTMTRTSCHDDCGWEAGSSSMGHTSFATRSSRRMVRSPIEHFKRLLEKACPNHAYPVRHKLKDYEMMRSYMTSGSLTWGAEPGKGPNRSDATPFPEEIAIMMVVGGHPLEGRRCMSSLGARISTRGDWGHGGSRV